MKILLVIRSFHLCPLISLFYPSPRDLSNYQKSKNYTPYLGNALKFKYCQFNLKAVLATQMTELNTQMVNLQSRVAEISEAHGSRKLAPLRS